MIETVGTVLGVLCLISGGVLAVGAVLAAIASAWSR